MGLQSSFLWCYLPIEYDSKSQWKSCSTWRKNACHSHKKCSICSHVFTSTAGNTRLVGAMVGELIKFLISSVDGSPELAERFYVVGVSLGAQTAGYAGNYLKEKGIKLGRITGTSEEGILIPAHGYFLDSLK